jgi:hypothetical protein
VEMRTVIRLRNALAVLSVLIWFSAFFLYLHYDATRPTSRQPVEGRVYAWNNHGHIVYLTKGEQVQLYALGVIAGSFFVTAAALGYSGKRRAG